MHKVPVLYSILKGCQIILCQIDQVLSNESYIMHALGPNHTR